MADSDFSTAPDVSSSPAPDLSGLTGPTPQPAPPMQSSPLLSASAADPSQSAPAQSPSAGTMQPASPLLNGPSMLGRIITAGITGLQGAGAKNFSEGVGNGARAEATNLQQQADNQQKQTFESMQAAHQMALAFQSARAADDTHQEAQLKIQKAADDINEIAGEKGIVPKVTVSGASTADMHAQGIGALQTLADANGGKVGRVVGVNSPDGGDASTPHQIHVYSVTPSDVDTNSTGTLWLVNAYRQAKNPGVTPLSQSDLQVLGGQLSKGNWKAGAASAANDATQFLFQPPPLATGKDAVSDNNAQIQTLTQQLTNYKNSPNPDPQIVTLLQHKADVFSSMVDGLNKSNIASKNQETLGTAGADANAAAQKASATTVAENSGAAGAAKTQQAVNTKNAETQLQPGNPQFTGQQYLQSIPDAGRRSLIQAVGEGRQELTPGMLRTKEGQALAQDVAQAYPGYDASKGSSYAATRKDFTSGKTATAINSYNTAIAHLGTMSDHVNSTNSFQINNPISDVHRQLDLDKNLVSTELAKAVSNGSMTEGEQKSIMSSISSNTTNGYTTRIREAVTLLNGKLGAYQQQWQNAMPSGAVTPIPIVSSQAQQTLSRISGNQQQASPRPAGATMLVPGSDGKMHWSDGKQDLGVSH